MIHYLPYGGGSMAISYNKLWKLLIDKGMKKMDLRKACKISPSTLSKLSKNQPVIFDVIQKICNELNCTSADIMDLTPDD
jgi:putative transcriptional regulator